MSIAPMEKVTLVGRAAAKPDALAALQRAGLVHLIELRDASAFRPSVTAPEEAHEALRHLRDTPRRRTQRRDPRGFDFAGVIEAALANRERLRRAEDRRAELARHHAAMVPWGYFEFPDPSALGGRRLWFYRIGRGERAALDDVELPWAIVARDPRHLYVVLIASEEPPPGILPEPRMHTGSRTLAALEAELLEVETEMEDLHAEKEALTRWIHLIERHLARLDDRVAFERAHHVTRDDAALFVLQGWVPAEARERLRALAADEGLALAVEAPARGETPPTRFEHPAALAAGEDLVRFYQTPAYGLTDPAPTVFFSFAVFFAMILADAAYGMLLGLGLLAAWRRLGRTETGRRLRTLGGVLALTTIAYGVLVGNYAGVSPAGDGALATLALLEVTDFGAMMHLAIVIGCLHVAFGQVLRSRAGRTWSARLRPWGWVAAIAGAYAYWQGGGALPEVAGAAGIAGIAAGLAWVLAFGGDAPVRRPRDLAARLGRGLLEVANVPAVFSDVLSYLRLMALGLASGSLALTFNTLAGEVRAASGPGAGLVLAALVLLGGHAVNLAIALLSACVHGLRLNFIEFFKYAVPEEGYDYDPLRLKELEL